jgi:hypothetical protein
MTVAAGAGSYAGPLGLLVVLVLVAVTVLLIRNMNARLRRLPPTFERETEDDATDSSP